MKIKIEKVENKELKKIVTAITDYGVIKGIWNYKEKTVVGENYLYMEE